MFRQLRFPTLFSTISVSVAVGCGSSSESVGGAPVVGGVPNDGGSSPGGESAAVPGGAGQQLAGSSPGGGSAGGGVVGASGSGGSSGGNGGSGETPPTLGTTCAPVGALNCSSGSERLTVLCSADAVWAPNQTCGGAEVCVDTGNKLGTCALPDGRCGARGAFCDGNDRVVCSANGFADDTATCDDACVDGDCVAICAESPDVDCAGLCGPPNSDCETPEFGLCRFLTIDLASADNETTVIAPSAVDAGCQRCSTGFQYLRFRFENGNGTSIEVEPPWEMALGIPSGCENTLPSFRCLQDWGPSATIVVFADAAVSSPAIVRFRKDSKCN